MQQFGICVYFVLSVRHEHRFCLAVNIWLIETLTMATVSDADILPLIVNESSIVDGLKWQIYDN